MQRTHTGRDAFVAGGLGIGLIVLGLLAADWPPPWGFAAYVVISLVIAGLVFIMLPRWRAARLDPACRSPRSPWMQGAAVGLVVWAVTVLLPFTGEPSVTVGWDAHLIGAAATASVFAAGAAIIARFG